MTGRVNSEPNPAAMYIKHVAAAWVAEKRIAGMAQPIAQDRSLAQMGLPKSYDHDWVSGQLESWATLFTKELERAIFGRETPADGNVAGNVSVPRSLDSFRERTVNVRESVISNLPESNEAVREFIASMYDDFYTSVEQATFNQINFRSTTRPGGII
jgi:hypothetical protein